MIAYLTGEIISKFERGVIVNVGGVGYGVIVSEYALEQLGASGDEVSLHIYTHVREQALELYGFLSAAEQQMFELLISVSGIGPKAAMSILSVADTATLRSAIVNDDVSILTQVSGIGKKTAGRVVLELKNKVVDIAGEDAPLARSVDADALEALCAMGYRVPEAREALSAVDKNLTDISDKVRAALRLLGK